MTVEPVTKWENQALNREVFMGLTVREGHLARVDKLRARQAEYLASLPTDPTECLSAALEVLQPDEYSSLPDGLEEAFNLAFAIEPMISDLMADDPSPALDALLFVARRVREGLEKTVPRIEHVIKIIGNPDRVTKEATAALALQQFNDRAP